MIVFTESCSLVAQIYTMRVLPVSAQSSCSLSTLLTFMVGECESPPSFSCYEDNLRQKVKLCVYCLMLFVESSDESSTCLVSHFLGGSSCDRILGQCDGRHDLGRVHTCTHIHPCCWQPRHCGKRALRSPNHDMLLSSHPKQFPLITT